MFIVWDGSSNYTTDFGINPCARKSALLAYEIRRLEFILISPVYLLSFPSFFICEEGIFKHFLNLGIKFPSWLVVLLKELDKDDVEKRSIATPLLRNMTITDNVTVLFAVMNI